MVGVNKREKEEALNKLLAFLANITELDLSHISGKYLLKNLAFSIIYEKDRASVKYLLEIIYELILVLKGENQKLSNEQEEEEVESDLEGSKCLTMSLNNSKDSESDFPIEKSEFSLKNKQSKISRITNETTNIVDKTLTKTEKKLLVDKNLIDQNFLSFDVKNSVCSELSKFEIKPDLEQEKPHEDNISYEINLETLDKTEIPLTDEMIKNEVKKILMLLCGDIPTYEKLSYKIELNDFIDHIVNDIKKINTNENVCIVTKDFLNNHQNEIEEIILYYLKQNDRKKTMINKIAKTIINDPKLLSHINYLNFQQKEAEVNKLNEKYNQERSNHKEELKICNEM